MFTVKLITYKGLYRQIEADSINLPTPDGRRGIRSNHMPFMTPIDIGVINTQEHGEKKKYTVSNGIFYFENNQATLLCDAIEDVDELDIERARIKEQRARERLKTATSESDIKRAEVALSIAINRIKALDSDR
ncbi:MAG: ATP synthase F1 subunit epsilon [Erysipelotrichaceae bacterium]|nr:ATP synthase F1 subunit epsilon [Erysipelotrichaceae bacterium]